MIQNSFAEEFCLIFLHYSLNIIRNLFKLTFGQICNKEETLRVLQDTIKLRECQIEELKYKMESSVRFRLQFNFTSDFVFPLS